MTSLALPQKLPRRPSTSRSANSRFGQAEFNRPRTREAGDIVPTVVSSLAEGAYRIVAAELLKRKGTPLEVVLPLPQNDYLHDFGSPRSVDQFDRLIARAIDIDALRTVTSREELYEQAGTR